MASNFPTSMQDLDATRGTTGQPLSAPNHITHHSLEDDTVEALQTKVGIDSSVDTGSLDYKLSNASSSNPGHKHTLAEGATDVTASAAELNYSVGVTSGIQAQINALAGGGDLVSTNNLSDVTSASTSLSNLGGIGAATTDTLTNKTIDADGTGNSITNIEDANIKAGAAINATKIGAGGVTSTEFGYIGGLTSDAQTQINAKAPVADPTFTGEIGIGSVNVSETELGILEGATLTTTEINYVDGVTSAIQTQLNAKGAGDLVSTNNLSDVTTAATALTNIGGIGSATTDTLTNKTIDANGTGNSISNIDVADLANGTDGELITWDAAGAPAVVAAGTATHVLTSNGAGAAPTFQAGGGGGGTPGGADTQVQFNDGGAFNGESTFAYNKTTNTASVTAIKSATIDTNNALQQLKLNGTTISAEGSDTNINVSLTPKGTGAVVVNGNISATNLSGTNTGDEVAASVTVAGVSELATTAEIDTGTDSTRTMPVDQFVASKRNVRWLSFNLVEAETDCATATNIAGDFVSPIAGTILQSDSAPFYIYATNSTAGTTGTMVIDVNINGTSIMTTNKLDIDSTEKTSTTGATQPDLTTTALAVGDIITIDIDAVHTTEAKGLTVFIGIRE